MVYYLDMTRLLDNLQMTFINRSVVISRAVTILRSNETYLCIEGLLFKAAWQSARCEQICILRDMTDLVLSWWCAPSSWLWSNVLEKRVLWACRCLWVARRILGGSVRLGRAMRSKSGRWLVPLYAKASYRVYLLCFMWHSCFLRAQWYLRWSQRESSHRELT